MLINLSDKKKKIKLYAINRKTGERVRVTMVAFDSKECLIKIPLEEWEKRNRVAEWQKYSHRADWELFMEIN